MAAVLPLVNMSAPVVVDGATGGTMPAPALTSLADLVASGPTAAPLDPSNGSGDTLTYLKTSVVPCAPGTASFYFGAGRVPNSVDGASYAQQVVADSSCQPCPPSTFAGKAGVPSRSGVDGRARTPSAGSGIVAALSLLLPPCSRRYPVPAVPWRDLSHAQLRPSAARQPGSQRRAAWGGYVHSLPHRLL